MGWGAGGSCGGGSCVREREGTCGLAVSSKPNTRLGARKAFGILAQCSVSEHVLHTRLAVRLTHSAGAEGMRRFAGVSLLTNPVTKPGKKDWNGGAEPRAGPCSSGRRRDPPSRPPRNRGHSLLLGGGSSSHGFVYSEDVCHPEKGASRRCECSRTQRGASPHRTAP